MADNVIGTRAEIHFEGEQDAQKYNAALEKMQKTTADATKGMGKGFQDAGLKISVMGKEIKGGADQAKQGLDAMAKVAGASSRQVGTSLADMRAEYKLLGDILQDPKAFAGASEEALEKMGADYRKLGIQIAAAEEQQRKFTEAMKATQKEGPATGEQLTGYGDALTQGVQQEMRAGDEMRQEHDKQVDEQKSFGERLIGEITKIGVLRGGVAWRIARAAGGPMLAAMAGIWVAQKALTAIRQAINSTIKSIDELVRSAGATRAFETMGAKAGIAFEGMAQQAREASGYALENYEITTTGNRLLSAGYDDIAGSMIQLSALARTMGDALGVDAAGQLNSLIEAIKAADAETLEAEYGFTGVTEALRAEAAAMGIGTDALGEHKKASVALGVVLPQIEGKIRDLGGAAFSSAGDVKAFWDEIGKLTGAITTGIGIDFMTMIGGDPSQLDLMVEQANLINQVKLALMDLEKAYRQGVIDQDAFAKAGEDAWAALGAFSGGATSGPLQGLDDVADRVKYLDDMLMRLRAAASGKLFDTSYWVPQAVADLKKTEDQIKDTNKALELIAEKKISWAVDLSEFMPIEDAKQRAGDLAQTFQDELVAVIGETGSTATAEGQAVIAKWGRLFAELLAALSEGSVALLEAATSDLVGLGYKKWDDLLGMAQDLAFELLPEGKVEQIKALSETVFKDLLATGIGPEGADTIEERFKVDAIVGGYRDLQAAQEKLNDLTDDWFVDLAEVMPLEDARRQADMFAALLVQVMADAGLDIAEIFTATATTGIANVQALVEQLIGVRGARDPAKIAEDARKTAQEYALGLAEYLPLEQVQGFADAIEKQLTGWNLEYLANPDSLEAQYARERIISDYEAIGDAIVDANKETKTSTRSMKDYADAALLTSQNLGTWAQAFAAQHGGAGPMQTYQRHEEPLVAAMVDKLWGEQFQAKTGKAPTQEDWQAHWYEQWMPLEAYPGGPIGKATGPLADQARKILADMGIKDLGQVYKDDWDKRNSLIGEMDLELTKREELTLALGGLVEYIKTVTKGGEEEPPTETEEEKAARLAAEAAAATVAKYAGLAAQQGASIAGSIPGAQHGGFTRTGGLTMLHPNELIIPLNRLVDMVGMRPGHGGGGLSIQTLNIPVNISGHSSLTPAGVQAAITNAIRGRVGTELVRAGRRIGL